MKVYFISGLAADRMVFKHIALPQACEAVHLDWIEPLKNESLKSYAMRLGEKIDTSQPFAVVGLSMGGMVASEIAAQMHPAAVVLISSIPAYSHLPGYFKLAGALRLHKLVPVSLIKKAAVVKRLFTTENSEDKKIIRKAINDSDPVFIRWAMDAILNWKNEPGLSSYIHIHGTSDEVLPIKYTRPTHIISKGSHMLVMNRAKEINKILQQTLTARSA
jgi:pimeloyl-ACP methyl ester carboxylesterase